jgi:apolipoprotein D and lipocalin family protein
MMSARLHQIIIPVFLVTSFCAAGSDRGETLMLLPVETVDLTRYTGLWYEIARLPNPFQKQCKTHTTAFYSLRKDGKVDVINRCRRADGTYIEARGLAKIQDPATCAVLKVSFVRILGLSLFWGDYWIIGLDDAYQWAIVGEPSRKYGWVLGRNPVMEEETWETIETLLLRNGYDPSKFIKTSQIPVE